VVEVVQVVGVVEWGSNRLDVSLWTWHLVSGEGGGVGGGEQVTASAPPGTWQAVHRCIWEPRRGMRACDLMARCQPPPTSNILAQLKCFQGQSPEFPKVSRGRLAGPTGPSSRGWVTDSHRLTGAHSTGIKRAGVVDNNIS